MVSEQLCCRAWWNGSSANSPKRFPARSHLPGDHWWSLTAGKYAWNLSVKVITEHFYRQYGHKKGKHLRWRNKQQQQNAGVYGRCWFVEKAYHATRGGLLRHLLSRVPKFLPCCATVVIPDFDRHSKTVTESPTVLVWCGGASSGR